MKALLDWVFLYNLGRAVIHVYNKVQASPYTLMWSIVRTFGEKKTQYTGITSVDNRNFLSKIWHQKCGVFIYVPETHIMYFIRRCWFLKCSEEIHYVPIGAGDMWYYVPVDDGWEEVLGRNAYITSQYFSPNAKYWTASSGNLKQRDINS
jgi:hypothetical protein